LFLSHSRPRPLFPAWLAFWLATAAAAGETAAPPPKPQAGVTTCADTLQALRDPDPKINEALQAYNFPADPFAWQMRQIGETEFCTVHHLTFPSPVHWPTAETNTVHGEYYLPRTIHGKAPAVVVLHILDERFILERVICSTFAAGGVPSLLMQLPYYGERRPEGTSLRQTFTADPGRILKAMEGAALDCRRAACWLQKRPEVDPRRIGLVGVSLGAVTGALVVAVDPRFSRNALILGGGDPAGILWHAPETAGVRARFVELGLDLADLRQLARGADPILFGKRVNPKQVLMMNALDDETIPRRYTDALWEAFGKPAIHWYPAGHYSMALFIPAILPIALDFVASAPADRERPQVK